SVQVTSSHGNAYSELSLESLMSVTHLLFPMLLIGLSHFARADDAVMLRYKGARGDTSIYQTVNEVKQSQAYQNIKLEGTLAEERIVKQTIDAAATDGTLSLTSQIERIKATASYTPEEKFTF